MYTKLINISICLLTLAQLAYAQPQQSTPTAQNWKQEAEGVWKVTVGQPEKLNLLNQLGNTPRLASINEIGKAELPIDRKEISLEVIDGKTYIRFPLEEGEKIFGLGLNFKTVEQRGRVMRLHIDHYGNSDNGRTHAPIPFFVSSKGYGALINVARYVDVWVGTGVRRDSKHPAIAKDRNTDPSWSAQPTSDNLEFLVPAAGAEILVFSGATMLDVVRRYNLYQGGGCLPPKWGLGFWHRVPSLFTDKQVEKEVEDFRQHGFPLNVVGLEPGWMTRAYPCTYEWDPTRFSNPKAFVEGLKAKGIRTNVWINPYVSPDGELYDKIKPHTGSHTVWCGLVPDYTLPTVQQLMTEHFKKHQLDLGVSGYKMDENDGYDSWLWPDVATFPSHTPAEQMRQIYGSLMQRVTTDMYRQSNQRTYGLVRAANAGTASYPYVLYNDYYDHRDFITALINSSFIGVLWTPEVRASRTSEEWLRRMQTVCFSPLAMLNAWADGTKPWSFPDVTQQVNDVALLRMQLIPYLYTTFADYAFKGIPPFRAMNLEEGYNNEATLSKVAFDGTNNPYAQAVKQEVKNQYMMGEYLLIAPLFAGERERKVVLPQGKWYDFYTGRLAGEGEVITAAPGLDRIPVYVKDGGLIPMFPPITQLEDKQYPLTIRHYGTAPGAYDLYDDDGQTYDYEQGKYLRIPLQVTVDAKGQKHGKATVPKGKKAWSFSQYTFQFMTQPQQKEIVINLKEKGASVSPSMYGVFFEEINHAGDGGLYAELVQNRSFEELEMPKGYRAEGNHIVPRQVENHLTGKVGNNRFKWTQEPVLGWSLLTKEGQIKQVNEGQSAQMRLTKEEPIFATAPNNLEVVINDASQPVSLVNEGYWGMNVIQGAKYHLRTIIRTSPNYKGKITAKLLSQKGELLASTVIAVPTSGQWADSKAVLEPRARDPKAKLALEFDATGKVWVDYVSLFPEDTFGKRPNGLRNDVANMLTGLKPAFVRWPGGCVVEGITLDNRFEWKKTLGDPAARSGEYSTWGYRCSYGFGYYELLQFCEDIKAGAMYVCNVGLGCQYRMGDACAEDQMAYYLDDCLDAIEYALGDTSTEWGAKRAAHGHPKPFPLQYVEIGNENWGDEYDKRFDIFYKAIKAKYPQLTLISNHGVNGTGNITKTDMIDPHWYVTPEYFYQNTTVFDQHPRGKYTAYVGEYACNQGVGGGNMTAALSEAAFITGMERNGDLVTMTSYAPLLENRNNREWPVNLIWLDTDQVVGRSSYYVQQMAAEHRPTYNVKSSVTLADSLRFLSSGYDETTQELILKVVNGSATPYQTGFKLNGARKIEKTGRSISLTATSGEEENSFAEPKKIYPQESVQRCFGKSFNYTFPPFSYTVLRVKARL